MGSLRDLELFHFVVLPSSSVVLNLKSEAGTRCFFVPTYRKGTHCGQKHNQFFKVEIWR